MAKATGDKGRTRKRSPGSVGESGSVTGIKDQNLDPLNMTPELDGAGKDQANETAKMEAAVARYWQRFVRAEMGMEKKHQLWTQLDKLNRGEQWKDKGIPPWIAKPVTNFIEYVRTTKRANLASAISRATFAPISGDDQSNVNQLQLAYNHVWDHIRVDRRIRECIDTSLLLGTAIAYVYMEDEVNGKFYKEDDPKNALFQGEICIRMLENANFFPDPDAYRLEQCKYIEVTEVMPANHVRENKLFRQYCEKSGWLDKLESINWSQVEIDDDASGTIYERDNYPNQNFTNIKGDEEVTVHQHWERYKRDGKWHLDVTYYLRNTDFFLLRIEDIQPNHYPFAIMYDEAQRNDFWGVGTCQSIMQNQEIINKIQQTASVLASLHQNPQKIVFRESGINAQEMARTGNLPGKVWVSNVQAAEAVQYLNPPEIPKGLFDVDDRTQANIKLVTGLNEAYTGQSAGSITTSTGVNDLIERATVRDKDKMIQIDEFVERISNLIVLHILYRWKDPRPIMVMGLKGEPEFSTYKPISKLDADNLSWRVKSNIYAKAPVTQASRRQQANNSMQMQGQFNYNPPIITPEEWVRAQEFDNENELLQRMEADRQKLEAQQAQMTAQNLVQLADHIHQLEMTGESQETVQQAALQMAQQILAQQNQDEERNGMSGQAPNAQKPPGQPQGVTSSVAAANMSNGRL